MRISEITLSEYEKIDKNEQLSAAISRLKKIEPPALIVEDSKGNYQGVIIRRRLRKSRVDPTSSKVEKQMITLPSIQHTETLAEAARLMIEVQTPILPVFSGEKHIGFISVQDIITQGTDEEWNSIPLESIMTKNPLSARRDDTVARILDLFRTYGISHLPVKDDGKLVGIVSIHDIFSIIFKSMTRQKEGFSQLDRGGHGERAGETSNLLHIPVSSVMSSPVIAAKPTETLSDAHRKMREYNISSVVVVDDDRVTGIVTKRDLLEPIAQRGMESRRIRVQFSMKPGIRMTEEERKAMQRKFESFSKRYRDVVGVGDLFVYLKRHGSISKGNQLIQCRLQFRTAHTQYYSSAEAWSVEETYSLALDRLERRIIEHKETKLSEKHSRKHIERFIEFEV